MYIWSLAGVTRVLTASRTVLGTSFAREGRHSVQGAVVQSSAGVCRRCHVAITSSTSSARSVVSRSVDRARSSESLKVDRIVTRALDDLLANEGQYPRRDGQAKLTRVVGPTGGGTARLS